ncbi:Unannotated [Lentimonas sp. CC6]|nr:Unannotated [Lentimonas sp. CC6]
MICEKCIHAISLSCCRGFACEARAKATRIGSCKTLAAFAGAALRQALGLEPVETASSTPTPDASISQITILDAREYRLDGLVGRAATFDKLMSGKELDYESRAFS